MLASIPVQTLSLRACHSSIPGRLGISTTTTVFPLRFASLDPYPTHFVVSKRTSVGESCRTNTSCRGSFGHPKMSLVRELAAISEQIRGRRGIPVDKDIFQWEGWERQKESSVLSDKGRKIKYRK